MKDKRKRKMNRTKILNQLGLQNFKNFDTIPVIKIEQGETITENSEMTPRPKTGKTIKMLVLAIEEALLGKDVVIIGEENYLKPKLFKMLEKLELSLQNKFYFNEEVNGSIVFEDL